MSRNFELMQQAEREMAALLAPRVSREAVFAKKSSLNEDDRFREEIMRLVQQVFPQHSRAIPRVVAFCGVERGDGCSQICTCVGETLSAQRVGSVCLVDANLHAPGLAGLFGMQGLRGFRDAAVGSAPIREFVQKLPGEDFWLLTSGSSDADAPNLLNSEMLRNRIKELRAAFNSTLIDLPPVNHSADALALGQMADGVVMVIGAHSTRREVAQRAKQIWEAANVRLLGAVLNRKRFPIPEKLYRKI